MMFALRPPRPLRSTTVLLGTMRFTNICIVAAALTLAACATQPPVTYDLVIANGRVMDPESNLDDVRHIGIRARVPALLVRFRKSWVDPARLADLENNHQR